MVWWLLLPIGIGVGAKLGGGLTGLLGIEKKSFLEETLGLDFTEIAIIGGIAVLAIIMLKK